MTLLNVQRLGNTVHWSRDGYDHAATERQVWAALDRIPASASGITHLSGCRVDESDLIDLRSAFALAEGFACRMCRERPVADTNADDLCRECEAVIDARSDEARQIRGAG